MIPLEMKNAILDNGKRKPHKTEGLTPADLQIQAKALAENSAVFLRRAGQDQNLSITTRQ